MTLWKDNSSAPTFTVLQVKTERGVLTASKDHNGNWFAVYPTSWGYSSLFIAGAYDEYSYLMLDVLGWCTIEELKAVTER